MRLSIVLFTLLLQPEAARAACQAGDLACLQPAVASSFEDSNVCSCEAELAVDGLPGTRWGSTLRSDPQWIYVNLGTPTTFDSVKLRWEAAYGKNYEVSGYP